MSNSKTTKDDLIADFEKMLKSDLKTPSSKSEFFQKIPRAKFDNYLRQITKHFLKTTDFSSGQPFYLHLDEKEKVSTLHIVVFSSHLLAPLPSVFWYQQKGKKFLFRCINNQKWEHLSGIIYSDPVTKEKIAQLPIQKISVEVESIQVPESEVDRRFFESVRTDVNNGEPNLRILLLETVYQQSRQEEFTALAQDTDSFLEIRKEFYKKNTQTWLKSLESMTESQKKHPVEFFVSEFKNDDVLLSQNEVDDLLKPAVKK